MAPPCINSRDQFEAETYFNSFTLNHEAESEALDALALTPCGSDAEFIEKLRYLYFHEAKIAKWPLPDNGEEYDCLALAASVHFGP